MQKTTNSNSGIYILELFASEPFNLPIKRFCDTELPKGYYYYIGSAQKNLMQRVNRHFTSDKRLHWHIDYLTVIESVILSNALIIENAPKHEEEILANNFPNLFDAKILLEGFGNSDTKGSITHLFYKNTKINYSHFSARYQSIVRFRPSSSE